MDTKTEELLVWRIDPADELVQQYLTKTQYSDISHFGYWIKNQHLLTDLSDDTLDSTKNRDEIFNIFGGFRCVINLILRDKYNINYVQHEKLFNLLTKLNETEKEDKYIKKSAKSIKSLLLSMNDSCISHIFNFLETSDYESFRECCTYLAIISDFKASKLNAHFLCEATKRYEMNSIDNTNSVIMHCKLVLSDNIMIQRKGLQNICGCLDSLVIGGGSMQYKNVKNWTKKYAKLLCNSGYLPLIIKTLNIKHPQDKYDSYKEYTLALSLTLEVIRRLTGNPLFHVLLISSNFFDEFNEFIENNINNNKMEKGVFGEVITIMINLLNHNLSCRNCVPQNPFLHFLCNNILNYGWFLKSDFISLLDKIIQKNNVSETSKQNCAKLKNISTILVKSYAKQIDPNWQQHLSVGDEIYLKKVTDCNVPDDGPKTIIMIDKQNKCIHLKGTQFLSQSESVIKVTYDPQIDNPAIKKIVDMISRDTILWLSSLCKKISLMDDDAETSNAYDSDDLKNDEWMTKRNVDNDSDDVKNDENIDPTSPEYLVMKTQYVESEFNNNQFLSGCVPQLQKLIGNLRLFCPPPLFHYNIHFTQRHKPPTGEELEISREKYEYMILNFISANVSIATNKTILSSIVNYLQLHNDEIGHTFLLQKILRILLTKNKNIFKEFVEHCNILPCFKRRLYFTVKELDIVMYLAELIAKNDNDKFGVIGTVIDNVDQTRRCVYNFNNVYNYNLIDVLIKNKFWITIKNAVNRMQKSQNIWLVLLKSGFHMLYDMDVVLERTGSRQYYHSFVDIVVSVIKDETFMNFIHLKLKKNPSSTPTWSKSTNNQNEDILNILYYSCNIEQQLCEYIMSQQTWIVDKILIISNEIGTRAGENALILLVHVILNCNQQNLNHIQHLINFGVIQHLIDHIRMHENIFTGSLQNKDTIHKYIRILTVLEILLKHTTKEITVDTTVFDNISTSMKKNKNVEHQQQLDILQQKFMLIISLIQNH